VAIGTQGDQIFFSIIAGLTPKFLVMYLESMASATALALPSVSPQNLRTEMIVRIGI
jgi:hypothetical protein